MRVGLGILLLALHNPLDVAETVATMDAICGGRFTLGVGLGYREVESNAFAVPRGERVRRLEANLALVQRLWAGEEVSADLPWCRLDAARLTMLPVQRPRPPLWMAADNDPAVERAARLADTWMINPHATTATIARQLDVFRNARAAAGLPPPPELPVIKEVVCAPTRERATELATQHLSEKYAAYRAWGQDAVLPEGETFDQPFAALSQGRFVVGTPDDCLEELLQWRDTLGVDHFVLRTHWSGMPVADSLSSMRLLTGEVLPELRRTATVAALEVS
jgi:alkanesulfonate monooxygenase SsuD/methylene tetrahydromethanopterin reductase-like flavin-dependent oxidoreductase (luciferase family)